MGHHFPPSSGFLLPSHSMATSPMAPNHSTATSHESCEGTQWRLCNWRGWFPCLGCQNATHQEIKRGVGPMPYVAAIQLKGATTNQRSAAAMGRICSWWGTGKLGWGGTLYNRFGHWIDWIKIKIKIREVGGPLAYDGCHLMERHNNQPKVGGSNGLGVGVAMSWAIRLGWVVILSFGPSKWATKNNKNKTRPIRCLPDNILHATTNQNHLSRTKEMMEKRFDWGGAQRKRDTIILGTIDLSGGKKLK